MHADPVPPILDAAATRERLPWPALVDALAVAAVEMAQGRIDCPPRQVVAMAGAGLLLSMPAVAADLVCHKLVTVVPANRARGLPTVRGLLSVLDPVDGRTRVLLDGPTVTGRRTAAISMLGLRTLGPPAPRTVLVVGTGAQAEHHVDALAALYPGVQVRVRGTSAAAAARFCDRVSRRTDGRVSLLAADDGDPDFDVLITCTTSRTPVYAEPARRGRLLIATGAFEPGAAEIAAATVRASAVVVDDPAGAEHEAGDILQAGVRWADVQSLASALQFGADPARPRLFKTVGCAAWDLAAARVACAALQR